VAVSAELTGASALDPPVLVPAAVVLGNVGTL